MVSIISGEILPATFVGNTGKKPKGRPDEL